MPLGASYADLAALKTRLGVTVSTSDTQLTEALAAASRAIEKFCNRQFNVAGSATARTFYPTTDVYTYVDDISTITGLVIKTDEGNDGTFEITWAATDYQLEPLNGVVDGEAGWPFYRIRAVANRWFPQVFVDERAPLEVTANWGWATVPAAVKETCLMLAEETFKMKDAPFGVAGFGEWGPVRVRQNPMAAAALAPYRRDQILVA